MQCNVCGATHGLGAFVERDAEGHMLIAGMRLEELSGIATVILGFVALYNIMSPRRRR